MNATDALQVVTQGMGTQMTHRLFGKHPEEAMRAVRAEADALSTLLFVAGMERGVEVLHQVPGAEAVFVDTAIRVYYTKGLKGRLQAEAGIKAICLHQ